MDCLLRAVTYRPWWNASEQKLHAPKQPRLCVIENSTSAIPGTAAKRLIGGMIGALIGQRIHAIQFLLSERIHRRILHKHLIAVPLLEQLATDMILLILLDAAGNRIFPLGFSTFS